MNNLITKNNRLPFFITGSFLLFLLPLLGYAQTGPGGVEKNDGTSRLRLWLRPENMGGSADGDSPSPWNDVSGYNRHFTNPAATGSTAPIRSNGVFGGGDFPAVRFQGGGGDFMSNPDLGNDLNNADWTVYVVIGGVNTVLAPHNDAPILSWGSFLTADTRERTLSYEAGGMGRFYTRSQPTDGSNPPVYFGSSTKSVMEAVGNRRIVAIHRNGATGDISFRIDGQTKNTANLAYNAYTDGTFVIGSKLDFSSALFDGHNLAEVVAFDNNLPEVQKIILDNYFARKYGVTLDAHDYSTGSGAYRHNPIGIGKYGDIAQTSATFTTAPYILGPPESGGGGIIRIEEHNGTLDNGEFVIASHILAHGKTSETSVIPASVGYDMWKRDFYIRKQGNVDIKLTFDTNNESTLTNNSYMLVYRATTGVAFSKVNITPCNNNGLVSFIIPDAQLQNGYYSIANESGVAQNKKLYSRASGDWQNPTVWTFSADGVTVNNPCNATPDINYEVFISAAHTVNISNNFQSAALVQVNGRLELSATSGHQFTNIQGSGLIRLTTVGGSANFPTHTSMLAFQSSGSVEYFGSNAFSFDKAGAFLTISGSATKTLTAAVTLEGSLVVSSGATLATNQNIDLKKEWINNGTVTITGGTVSFSNTTSKQTITGATNFNNLTVAKAASRNLELNSSIGVAGRSWATVVDPKV